MTAKSSFVLFNCNQILFILTDIKLFFSEISFYNAFYNNIQGRRCDARKLDVCANIGRLNSLKIYEIYSITNIWAGKGHILLERNFKEPFLQYGCRSLLGTPIDVPLTKKNCVCVWSMETLGNVPLASEHGCCTVAALSCIQWKSHHKFHMSLIDQFLP